MIGGLVDIARRARRIYSEPATDLSGVEEGSAP